MAKSQYAYVRSFENPRTLLPHTYIVIRLDGRSFTSFSDRHGFAKPNDKAALQLMNKAAIGVFDELGGDVKLAFGESDEFSWVLSKQSTLFKRRESKLVSLVASRFAASYVFHWPTFFPETPLQHPPAFDARTIELPTLHYVREYLAWRQVDTHINNLYNTTFWALRQRAGLSGPEATERLKGTVSGDKNEILWSQFGINYNDEDLMFKKGSLITRAKESKELVVQHVDIIGDAWWKDDGARIFGEVPRRP